MPHEDFCVIYSGASFQADVDKARRIVEDFIKDSTT